MRGLSPAAAPDFLTRHAGRECRHTDCMDAIVADALSNPVASVRLSARVRRAGYFSFSSEEKVTKKTPPRMPRRLRRFARAGRGSLNAPPCACNELARIVRATLRAFPSCPRRGKRGPEDQEHRQDHERPLPPFGHLVLATSLWLALRAASAANIGNPADVSPLRRGREKLLLFALDLPPPSPHRALQVTAGERRACPSAGMREFAPARRREAQGTSRAQRARCGVGGVSLCLLSLHEQRK